MTSTATYTDKIIPSWEETFKLSDELAMKLLPRKHEFKTVVAVTRGGLIPATIVARRLDIKSIDTVGITSYEGDTMSEQGNLKIIKSIPGNGEGCLVIDDLVDKGTTAQVIREMLPKSVIAVLYAKPSGKPYADVYVGECAQHTWVEFPWEKYGPFTK